MTESHSRAAAYAHGILNYYNRVLLSKGLISERDYHIMKEKIRTRTG